VRRISESLAWPARRALPLAVVLIDACTTTGGQATSDLVAPAGCVVRETSRAPLLIDGNREMYVEPTVALPSGGRILLAGRPNYLFSPGASTDERTMSRDSVFGVVLDSRGRATLVPAPIDPALVASARAIALSGGRWALLFAELKHPSEPPRPDTIVRLWYGEFDGTTWSSLEQLPQIPGGTFNLEMGSELLPRADTLFAAVPIRIDSGSYHDIAVFERHMGRWKADVVHTVTGVYAELLYSDSLGLLLAVVQPDRALRRDTNSLLLYGRRPRWEKLRRILVGGSQPVYDPRFMTSPAGTVLSWFVHDRESQPPTDRARAMIGLTVTGDGRTVELDPHINHVTPVPGFTRFPLWITEHNTTAGEREIRFLADSAGHGQTLAAFPSPFTGPFAATSIGASDILVSGPLFHADSAHPRLVSLLIRARVECRTSAP